VKQLLSMPCFAETLVSSAQSAYKTTLVFKTARILFKPSFSWKSRNRNHFKQSNHDHLGEVVTCWFCTVVGWMMTRLSRLCGWSGVRSNAGRS